MRELCTWFITEISVRVHRSCIALESSKRLLYGSLNALGPPDVWICMLYFPGIVEKTKNWSKLAWNRIDRHLMRAKPMGTFIDVKNVEEVEAKN